MEFLWFILIGIIAGSLAGVVMKCNGCGIIGDMVAGVIGSTSAGLLFHFFGSDMNWGEFG